MRARGHGDCKCARATQASFFWVSSKGSAAVWASAGRGRARPSLATDADSAGRSVPGLSRRSQKARQFINGRGRPSLDPSDDSVMLECSSTFVSTCSRRGGLQLVAQCASGQPVAPALGYLVAVTGTGEDASMAGQGAAVCAWRVATRILAWVARRGARENGETRHVFQDATTFASWATTIGRSETYRAFAPLAIVRSFAVARRATNRLWGERRWTRPVAMHPIANSGVPDRSGLCLAPSISRSRGVMYNTCDCAAVYRSFSFGGRPSTIGFLPASQSPTAHNVLSSALGVQCN